jgi:hypothetical protein
MAERILLVDYENIQAVDLETLPDDGKVGFVLGGKPASRERYPPPLSFRRSPWGVDSTMCAS